MDQSKRAPAGAPAWSIRSAPAKGIFDTANAEGNLTTFTAGLRAAGLPDALAQKGPFTVFAPTDEAFAKLPTGAYQLLLKDPARLKAILNYHIVSGYFMARDVKSGEVMTLQGSTLTAAVSAADVRVNGARVTQGDIVAANGVVHVIDAVILPKHWQLTAAAA
jgi:uncharacterized surface protein with fasciclin (FAS1) repeats